MNVSRETSSGAVQYAERVWRASSDNRYILWHPERETALRMTEAEAQALAGAAILALIVALGAINELEKKR
jgi:hypothetical protein